MLFTFGSANTFDFSGLLGLTPGYFKLTPDASNPKAHGFILSGAVTEATPDIPGGGSMDWAFQLQTLGGQPLITGLTATVTGTSSRTILRHDLRLILFDACTTKS